MTMADAAAWAERYFAAWKSNDAGDVAALFAEEAVYYYGPFRPPARGREEIVRRWVSAAPEQDVASAFEVIAAAGDTAVIHWRVTFDAERAMDGVLIVRFDEQGACREHREWYAEKSANA